MTTDLSKLVVEVLHNRGDDNHPDWSVGSGFFVSSRLVLTALHNVDGPGELLVRIHGTEEHPAVVLLQGDMDIVDLAVLEVSDVTVDIPQLHYGTVDRSRPALVERCWAIGFPQLKVLKHKRGKPKPPPSSAHVYGEIPTGEYLGQQLLTLKVRDSPRPQSRGSEWEGMSGAVVFSGDYIVVGVITEHHLPEGESALTVVPITAIDDLLPEAETTKWWKLLGMDHQALVRLPGDVHIDFHRPMSPLTTRSTHPTSYLPFFRNTLFQPRLGEFEDLESLLLRPHEARQLVRVGLVGVTGMGGIGKTQLAIEFAYRYQERFPGGIFWMTAAGHTLFDWQLHFAELASNTEYLPADDDISHPENERNRARHFCRYLAGQTDALLILDNVEDPNLVLSVLPELAGKEPVCAILYTSRSTLILPGIAFHSVELLPEDAALRLLLESTRPNLFAKVIANHQDEEADAARSICQETGYLPLALVHLRGLLTQDQTITLVRLAEVLRQRGALDLAKTQQGEAKPLFEVFRLSWEKVQNEDTQRLFKLASYFPEGALIPLWLLGLAAGLGEKGDIFEPLGEARGQLQKLSLMEALPGNQVRLHPLVRQFGRRLIADDGEKGMILLEEAGEQLATGFADLKALEQRAQQDGYWGCLEQVRAAYEYSVLLGTNKAEVLLQIERWLDRESYLLGNQQWWPQKLPGLLYQQLYNRSVEEGHPFKTGIAPTQWLRQEGQVGAEDYALLRRFAGHSDEVTSVAFSPDGSKVLSGSKDQTARLWETRSGKLLAILHGHEGSVESVAFSFDGNEVMTASKDGTVRLWEATSGRQVAVLLDHFGDKNTIDSMVLSSKSSRLVTGLYNGDAQMWEVASGKLLATFESISPVDCVAFSPDGSKVLTGKRDSAVYVWDAVSGKLVATLQGHTGSVKSAAFSPDGNKVITGSIDGTARVWEVVSGKLLATLQGGVSSVESVVMSVAFSADGSMMLSGSSDHIVQLWEVVSGKLVATLQGHTSGVTSVTFSPDGSKVLSGSKDKTVRLWEATSGKTLAAIQCHADAVWSEAFSPDGSKILTGSRDSTARMWEVTSGKLVAMLQGHKGFVTSVAFSPDGSKVLSGSYDGTARVWATSGKLIVSLGKLQDDLGWVESVVFSPDGSKVLIGTYTGRVCLWDIASRKVLAAWQGHDAAVWSVAFSPDGRQLLTGSWDKTARLWAVDGKLVTTFPCIAKVWSVAFSPNGEQMLTGLSDGTVLLWAASGKIVATLKGHSEVVAGVKFSLDGRLVATYDQYGQILLWRASEPEMGKLMGMYIATYQVEAIRWEDTTHLILADDGGPRQRPYFYRLKLEGPS